MPWGCRPSCWPLQLLSRALAASPAARSATVPLPNTRHRIPARRLSASTDGISLPHQTRDPAELISGSKTNTCSAESCPSLAWEVPLLSSKGSPAARLPSAKDAVHTRWCSTSLLLQRPLLHHFWWSDLLWLILPLKTQPGWYILRDWYQIALSLFSPGITFRDKLFTLSVTAHCCS